MIDKKENGIVEGAQVLYVLPNGKVRPAVIVNAWSEAGYVNGEVNLQVFFTDFANDELNPVEWRTSVVTVNLPMFGVDKQLVIKRVEAVGYLTMCGGGGGAGACNASGNSYGSGGGAGGYVIKFGVSVTPGSSYTVTVGAAGTGGTAGANNATAGGNSSFAPLLTCTGGAAGNNPGSSGGAAGTPNGVAGGMGVAGGAPYSGGGTLIGLGGVGHTNAAGSSAIHPD